MTAVNRKQRTTGEDDGRLLAVQVQEERKLDALVLLSGPVGKDDKAHLLALSLAMARWASAGALAAEGGEQGAYARQATEWVTTYGRVAKATLPGEVEELKAKLAGRQAKSAELRALKGGKVEAVQ